MDELDDLQNNNETINEETYLYFVKHYQYQDLISTGIVMKIWGNHLQNKLKDSVNFIKKNLNQFIKNKTSTESLKSVLKIILLIL